jgi:hypothetical protein
MIQSFTMPRLLPDLLPDALLHFFRNSLYLRIGIRGAEYEEVCNGSYTAQIHDRDVLAFLTQDSVYREGGEL